MKCLTFSSLLALQAQRISCNSVHTSIGSENFSRGTCQPQPTFTSKTTARRLNTRCARERTWCTHYGVRKMLLNHVNMNFHTPTSWQCSLIIVWLIGGNFSEFTIAVDWNSNSEVLVIIQIVFLSYLQRSNLHDDAITISVDKPSNGDQFFSPLHQTV